MAARQWTTEQKQCIEADGGPLLVSAAAGSGKTAVLVQRILHKITREENPVSIDRLLVVTFTKAAAAEMKQRIAAELSRRMGEHPGDRRLRRQQGLLPRAAISTVDSFCAKLVREHFHLLDISPQFRVAEDAETRLLRDEAVGEIIEEAYAQAEPGVLELADMLGNGKNDRRSHGGDDIAVRIPDAGLGQQRGCAGEQRGKQCAYDPHDIPFRPFPLGRQPYRKKSVFCQPTRAV